MIYELIEDWISILKCNLRSIMWKTKIIRRTSKTIDLKKYYSGK
jgi:hypothetical protein